jgi:hypothetical protein
VLRHVVECLLSNSIKVGLDDGRRAVVLAFAVADKLKVGRDAPVSRPFLYKTVERGRQPRLFKLGRAKLPRQVTDVPVDPMSNVLYLEQLLVVRLR